jgi:pimeloyl-ACP methyl ester carboxylesterase
MHGNIPDTTCVMSLKPNETGGATTDARLAPGVTLFCIPHAGGGASAYRQWAEAMAPAAAVKVLQLRGRESRFREPPLTELEDAVADLYQTVLPASAGRFAFLGHSMGALMALELSHKLRREAGRAPVHLFVSACRAPNHPQLAAPCAGLPQGEFVAEVMRRYGGIPAPILADAAGDARRFRHSGALPHCRAPPARLPDLGVRRPRRSRNPAIHAGGLAAADHGPLQPRDARWRPFLSAGQAARRGGEDPRRVGGGALAHGARVR